MKGPGMAVRNAIYCGDNSEALPKYMGITYNLTQGLSHKSLLIGGPVVGLFSSKYCQ